jgi:hypothetical protein
MTCPKSKHIIHPARFENQNLTNTQGEYDIEKSLKKNARYTCMVYLDWLYCSNGREEEQHNMFTTMEAKRLRKLCH